MKAFFVALIGIFSFVIYPLFVFWFLKNHTATWFDSLRTRLSVPSKPNPFLDRTRAAAHGIIFGIDKLTRELVFSPSDHEGHTFVVGGTGTGKTAALLIPTLLSWIGTFFVIDISGDIYTAVNCINKLLYAPGLSESIPYDIFHSIDELPSKDDKNEALAELALLLIPRNEHLDGAARYFETGGRNILTAALVAFYHAGLDFIDICKKIVSLSPEELFSEISKTENTIANMLISGFRGEDERNVAGCKNACDSAINFFATNETVGRSIRRPEPGECAFTPESIETNNVFVVIPDVKLSLYAPLLRIIISQCLAYFSNRPTATSNILLCLDEFASFGKIDIVPALRKLRKKHVRIVVLTQSVADIDAVHGHDAHRIMMSNFNFRVVLSAFDTQDQRYFSEMIGQNEQEQVSTTYGGNLLIPSSKTIRTGKEFIVDPAELGRLGNELILLYPGGHARLEKNFYFKKAEDKPSLKSKLQSMLKSW